MSLTDWVQVADERREVLFQDLESSCALPVQVVEDTEDNDPRSCLHDEVDGVSYTLRPKP